jgi:hypothetical protein
LSIVKVGIAFPFLVIGGGLLLGGLAACGFIGILTSDRELPD